MQSFDDRDGTIWHNGEMVEWRDAKTHVLCHGLHYGGSVFEGLRIYNGKIFKLNEHSVRFLRSGELIDMPLPYSVDDINKACQDVIDANNIQDGYLRPVAWRGPEELGVGATTCKTHVAIATWEWPSYYGNDIRENGITLRTSRWRRSDPKSMPTDSKAACLYAVGTLAKNEAGEHGYNDALMLDYRGYVAEATSANLFMAKDGIIHTPIPDCFLNGITRQTIISIAKQHDYDVIERIIMPDELLTADEIFVTGTAAEVTAVGKIDHTTFKVGDITRTLRDAYEVLVGKVT